jgi:hypothetical protein
VRHGIGIGTIAVSAVLWLSSAAITDEGWADYKSEPYGFSMLVPEGVKFTEKEQGGGWGTLQATHEGVTFIAIGKLGEPATPEEIERFGVRFTGISANHWKQVDKGENKNGWKWYRTVEATDGKTLIFGGYGTGPKGSYLLLIRTTNRDYQEHKNDYRKWYDSIRLF